MNRFSQLYTRLDETNATNEKVAAMADYFTNAVPEDAAWAVFFLTGQRLKRLISARDLMGWATTSSGLPEWLANECHAHVGDTAETVALLLPNRKTPAESAVSLRQWVEERLLPLKNVDEEQRQTTVTAWWQELDSRGCFVLNKLMTGALRVGVSKRLVIRALAKSTGQPLEVIAHRLMGSWKPSASAFEALGRPDDGAAHVSRPYPFFLASPLTSSAEEVGLFDEWQMEWKWDGIRGQLIRREGQTFLWSRGEDLLEGRFPELELMAESLPDGTVLDGEILAWENGTPLPFARLQRRIGRLKPSRQMQKEHPVVLMAYDLLELDGQDCRSMELAQRRVALQRLVEQTNHHKLHISPLEAAANWSGLSELRESSRARGVEGLMLKRKSSPYRTGRVRGDWWKWKIDPLTIDAVLVYAQPGSGRRSNLLTDYIFAVWDSDQLITIGKAYSGLTNPEIERLDRWIRQNTTERFGPVRAVRPQQVFEIAFEGINASGRHKSGVALRFPRMSRWREDLSVTDADTLAQVKALLETVAQ